MHINAEGSFERVWFFTFAVQRLHGVAAAVAAAMAGERGGGMRRSLEQCEAQAAQHAGNHAAGAALSYAHALAAVRRLGERHAAFIAQPADGQILDCLAETTQVLEQYACALEALGLHGDAHAEAEALRREARRCDALRTRAG